MKSNGWAWLFVVIFGILHFCAREHTMIICDYFYQDYSPAHYTIWEDAQNSAGALLDIMKFPWE